MDFFIARKDSPKSLSVVLYVSWTFFIVTREGVEARMSVVTRMVTSKSGWTPYVYYTTLYSIPRYSTYFNMRIYWARELSEKWGNQSKRLVQGKELHTLGLSTDVR